MDELFEESASLVDELLGLIDLPIMEGNRVDISDTACSLGIEHWHAVRSLLQLGLLPSALVVHRAQFEALVRSFWLLHAAREVDLVKLTATLDLESEQATKNMTSVAEMMRQLAKTAPVNAYDALARFKEHNWKPLNSYVHAGIHPLRRHADGYPEGLFDRRAVQCQWRGCDELHAGR